MKEEIESVLMKDPQVKRGVEMVLNILKEIEVDGETMQYIIEQVGMEEQMLKQLKETDSSYEETDTSSAEKDSVGSMKRLKGW